MYVESLLTLESGLAASWQTAHGAEDRHASCLSVSTVYVKWIIGRDDRELVFHRMSPHPSPIKPLRTDVHYCTTYILPKGVYCEARCNPGGLACPCHAGVFQSDSWTSTLFYINLSQLPSLGSQISDLFLFDPDIRCLLDCNLQLQNRLHHSSVRLPGSRYRS